MKRTLAQRIIYHLLKKLRYGKITIINDSHRTEFLGSQSQDIGEVVLTINNKKTFSNLLLSGTNGAAESYIKGYWEADDLTKLIQIIIVNEDVFQKIDNKFILVTEMLTNFYEFINFNNRKQAKKNILQHYDLGNDFFQIFLDKKMMYSCAVYEPADIDLEEAATLKLRTICQHLKLNAEDHLLEIGTGWGGLSIFAAEEYGCQVTTTTISDKQFHFVKEEIAKRGLQDKIKVLNQDYRDLTGQYDKLVSVEMIEAVGFKYFKSFFKKCNELIKPGGLFFLQGITINDDAYEQAKNNVDFIKKYIFPGGCLPSKKIINESITNFTELQLLTCNEIGQHYVKTLSDWMNRFHAKSESIKLLGFSEEFIRTWHFYFCYCIAGFKESYINNIHALWQKRSAHD